MNPWNVNNDKVIIGGWDPVSWFNGKPQKGKSTIHWTFEGFVFWFCDEQNKKTFQSNPTQYAPQYGGFCAYGVSQGKSCDINPNCWTVEDECLYLFSSDEAKSNWLANQSACSTTADTNWSKGKLAAA